MSIQADSTGEQSFQPGQLGLRHLLGAMTAVAVVAALTATTVRDLPAPRAAEIGLHWLIVAVIAAVIYIVASRRQRRDRRVAGRVLLRVLRRTPREQSRKKWLLTSAVVVDGIVVTAIVLPNISLWQLVATLHLHAIAFLVFQGGLWGACLDHWLARVHWLDFCENGLLTHAKFYPWQSITRIGWSPMHADRLVVLSSGVFEETPIDPRYRSEVGDFLASSRFIAQRPME
jgi:hypothetical protein